MLSNIINHCHIKTRKNKSQLTYPSIVVDDDNSHVTQVGNGEGERGDGEEECVT